MLIQYNSSHLTGFRLCVYFCTCRDGVVVAVLGCHGYHTCELVLDKTAELLQKGIAHFLLNTAKLLTVLQ